MYKDMDELFLNWKKRQEEEEGCRTLPKGAKKEVFHEDGFLTPGARQADVLFILKEAHNMEDEEFWFREVVRSHGACDNNTKYYEKLKGIYQIITGSDELEKAAYMNINKRGGGVATNRAILDNYACEYKEFIEQEIKLINPKYVISMGVHDIIMRRIVFKIGKGERGKNKPEIWPAYKDNETGICYIGMNHPATPKYRNAEKYIEYFREIWETVQEM